MIDEMKEFEEVKQETKPKEKDEAHIVVRRITKQRLYDHKIMGETWDDCLTRLMNAQDTTFKPADVKPYNGISD
jgi:hypothetical protein